MDNKPTVFILSDGTGETASMMLKSAIVQYRDREINIVKCRNVRTVEQVESLFDDIISRSGMLVHTLASQGMRRRVAELSQEHQITAVDLLGPLMTGISDYLGTSNTPGEAGLLRAVDEKYFKRIEAIEYTVKHDDGKLSSGLKDADIVLVGISRTSKTPLSIYLSHKGYKVANIPLVLGSPLPDELFEIDQRRVVGLLIDGDSLYRIRRKRLEKFGQDPGSEYASKEHIHKEIDYATELYKKNRRWPIFDVTDRALEETASEIVRMVNSRLGLAPSL